MKINKNDNAIDVLINLDACDHAKEWIGDRSVQDAWDDCQRGDWMLWIYAKVHPSNLRELSLAKGYCANTVRGSMRDPRSIEAVDAAIAFGEGRIDLKELNNAHAAANAHAANAHAAHAAANAHAAHAAAHAAADAAAHAAANAAAHTYAVDAAANAEKINRQQTAYICRRYLEL